MSRSPFKYGVTVSKSAFTNREKETEKLFNNLTQGINTTIISPRRWGKSSLVEKVINDINSQFSDVKTVLIDLFTVSSEEEFLEEFAKGVIKASSSKWDDWMQSGRKFFKQLIPKLSVGVDPNSDFTISFDWSEIKKHKEEILDLPELIAEKQNIRFVICLDEFQNLASFSDYESFEKKMRAIWQRQKHVTYCLYGSKRHMMTEIFNNSSKPFYRFGDIIILNRITTEKWVNFIIKSFTETNKSIAPDFAATIVSLMQNHSWYVQQLAHYVWQRTDNEVTQDDIKTAFIELVNANSPLYQKEIETMSKTQLNLLKAIANKEGKLTSATVMQKYSLGTPRNVSKNKTILINNDIIYLNKGVFDMLDPVFEHWFKKEFYGKEYDQVT